MVKIQIKSQIMKKILLTIFASLLVSTTFAQQRLIAIKGSVTDTIANTLSQAIDIAQPGDKIYLPGGYFSHTPAIEKEVYIIGTGFQDGQNVSGKTTISGNLTLGAGANGSTFEGFYLSDWFIANVDIDDITIKRCNMLGTYFQGAFSNSNFINCVVRETLYLGYYSYGQGNFILNSFIPILYGTQYSTIKNCVISNYIGACDHLSVQNNIFGRTDCILFSECLNITFENNIIPQTCLSTDFGTVVTSQLNNIGFSSINTLFIVATSFEFNPIFDYHLHATYSNISSAGIFGGDYPWKVGSLPIIPNIEQNNSYLDAQNQTFKLNVKVVPQTH